MSTPAPTSPDSLVQGNPDGGLPGVLPRLTAEAVGSLIVVVVGLGVPLFSIPQTSPLPAALAAGLAVTAAMLAFGHVSGGHFNPAITLGHLLAGRISAGSAAAYAAAQSVGAFAGALALYGILRTLPGIADSRTAFDTVAAGFGEHSIIQAPLAAVLLLEVLGTAIIVAVFLGAASRDTTGRDTVARDTAPASIPASLAVGLSFAALLQLGQSVGNVPFNPARAAASALFSSEWAIGQVWVFVAAPLAGAVVAGLAFRSFTAGAAASSVATSGEPATAEPVAEPQAPGLPDQADEAREFFDGKRR